MSSALVFGSSATARQERWLRQLTVRRLQRRARLWPSTVAVYLPDTQRFWAEPRPARIAGDTCEVVLVAAHDSAQVGARVQLPPGVLRRLSAHAAADGRHLVVYHARLTAAVLDHLAATRGPDWQPFALPPKGGEGDVSADAQADPHGQGSAEPAFQRTAAPGSNATAGGPVEVSDAEAELAAARNPDGTPTASSAPTTVCPSPGANGSSAGAPDEPSEDAEPSRTPNAQWGGVFAHLPLRAEAPLVREVRAILQRLVGDAAEDDGPRMDVPRSVARLLAHRSDWVVRREEVGRPALLILIDVSGSCSRFAPASVRIAAAIAQLGLEGADVLVVVHSNGYPCEAAVNTRSIPVPDEGDQVQAWYIQKILAYDLRHVVAIGDMDAEWLYRDLAHRPGVERFLWLDGWRARVYGAPRADPGLQARHREELRLLGWPAEEARKVRYVCGCGDVRQFAAALRLGLG